MIPKSLDNIRIMRTAIFPGSFNPFTIGHKSVADRALPLFDRLVIAIGHNEAKQDTDVAGRVAQIRKIYADEPKVEVLPYTGLTVELASRLGAGCILRGVRSVADFEYESNMADVNRRLTGIETVLLLTLPEHACVSSSVVRELEHYQADISQFIP